MLLEYSQYKFYTSGGKLKNQYVMRSLTMKMFKILMLLSLFVGFKFLYASRTCRKCRMGNI